jgi:hypothetical protein
MRRMEGGEGTPRKFVKERNAVCGLAADGQGSGAASSLTRL